MPRRYATGFLIAAAVVVSACSDTTRNPEEELKDINVIDDSNLSQLMLSAADADEAVNYFRRAVAERPGRIDLLRGLAISLVRAERPTEAVTAWRKVVEHPDATDDDRVSLADALIRAGNWDEAEKILDAIPPTHETYDRYRIEAMIADYHKEWKKADSFYEQALALSPNPAAVLNNWGFSKLLRGDAAGAEKLLEEAVRNDPTLFTAKNNLVLARGAQGKYSLPVVPMTQIERAQLLHTLGLAAVKRGDVEIAKRLFREAIETHPQYFEAAVTSLEALESKVVN